MSRIQFICLVPVYWHSSDARLAGSQLSGPWMRADRTCLRKHLL